MTDEALLNHFGLKHLQSGFSQTYNIGNNANITWRRKKSSDKMLPPVRIESGPLMNLWFQVQHSPFWAKWAIACMTETLGSLYSNCSIDSN